MKRRPRLTQAGCDRARRLSEVHTRATVAAMLRVTPSTIRAAEARGWKAAGAPKRAVPNDWCLIAPGRTLPQLAKHYRASQTTVFRWRREKPVALPRNGGTHWQPPSDFAAMLEAHSARAVSQILGVHEHTVMAARLRLGIHPTQVAQRRSVGWAERYAATRAATPFTTGAPA